MFVFKKISSTRYIILYYSTMLIKNYYEKITNKMWCYIVWASGTLSKKKIKKKKKDKKIFVIVILHYFIIIIIFFFLEWKIKINDVRWYILRKIAYNGGPMIPPLSYFMLNFINFQLEWFREIQNFPSYKRITVFKKYNIINTERLPSKQILQNKCIFFSYLFLITLRSSLTQ